MKSQLGITELNGRTVKLMPLSGEEAGLTVMQIIFLHENPFTTCPACEGACVSGLAVGFDPATGMIAGMLMPCGVCEGIGYTTYYCLN